MIPRGYREPTKDDIGSECYYPTDISDPVDKWMTGTLIDIRYFGRVYKLCDSETGDDRYCQFCYIKKDKPSKTITLDPMLEARLTNIDRMILEREIELKLLRKLKGEEK